VSLSLLIPKILPFFKSGTELYRQTIQMLYVPGSFRPGASKCYMLNINTVRSLVIQSILGTSFEYVLISLSNEQFITKYPLIKCFIQNTKAFGLMV